MRFFVVPIVWVVIVLPIGPVPALLAGILAFFLYPLWFSWRVERAAEKAENRRAAQWDAKHDNCLYCYENKPDHDEFHFRIWSQSEQEEADFSVIGMEHPGAVPGYNGILNTNRFDVNRASEKAMSSASSSENIEIIKNSRDRILGLHLRF
jgi:hypothetical protein